MKLLDLTLPTPEENVALDEALLDAAEAEQLPAEVLRLWEPDRPLVVVGRSSHVSVEVNVEACRREEVPILRRASGGAAIVAAPGCLMYAVVLRYEEREHLRMLDETHRHVLSIVRRALLPLAGGIEHLGTSDLARSISPGAPPLKFSGNSVRCKRNHFLYHGTLLYRMDLSLVERLLGTPPRQPEYRAGRPHEAFVANLPLAAAAIRQALIDGFEADRPLGDWPQALTAQLTRERYSQSAWNFER